MTNLEYLLSDAWRENLVKIITDNTGVREANGAPVRCDQIYCSECRFHGEACATGLEAWLKEEHIEPPAFQKGTVVEILDGDDSRVGYYNGVYNNGHYVTEYKGYIGNAHSNGEPYGDVYVLSDLRKVGE